MSSTGKRIVLFYAVTDIRQRQKSNVLDKKWFCIVCVEWLAVCIVDNESSITTRLQCYMQ